MKSYDEYQKSVRYKYESHAFTLVMALTMLNFFVGFVLGIQWALVKEMEAVVIIFIALMYSVVMNVYHGAYFTKWQNPLRNSVVFFILGIIVIGISLASDTPLLVDSQLSTSALYFLFGIMFLSVPCSYIAKVKVEKERDREIVWKQDNIRRNNKND